MADKKRLADWLFSHRKELNLQVTQASWTEEWLSGYQDFRVQISANGKTYEGRGISRNSDHSFLVAGAEALERAFCSEAQIHSNGVALHVDENQAKQNARLELLERDGFLCHYLTKTPFCSVDESSCQEIDISALREKLSRTGVKLQIGRVMISEPKMVVCLATKSSHPNPFKCIVGLGASDDLSHALTKAITECLSNVVWKLSGTDGRMSIDLATFNDLKEYSPVHQRNLFLSNDDSLDLEWVFDQSLDEPVKSLGSEIYYEKVEAECKLLKKAPVQVVRARSNFVQDIFYGPTRDKDINLDRLSQFSKANVTVKNVNKVPHPIG